MLDEDERQRRIKQKEHEEMIRKRDQHIAQLDATKKLYINEIMRRSAAFGSSYYDYDMDEEERRNIRLSQDKNYF